ncbi:MAG TPA: helix-turn-helix domain-containing protein [Sorangium sp.]|nr:helix-turn-helix domain-containing protein [Sorangium sp.]
MLRLNESRIGGVITDAFAARASPSLVSTLHAQHATMIYAGLDGDVTVTEEGSPPIRARVVVVPPEVDHATFCPGPAIVLHHDPELAPEVAVYARQRGRASPIEGRLAARLGGALHSHRASLSRPDVLAGLACESAAWFAEEAPRRDLDTRVASVVEALRDPDADRHLVLARTRLSAAHLQALFVRDVGVPIRTYLLWRRLLIAIASCVRLDNTNAAHFAGFSDLAHLSRTCRRMLGYSPTLLRREFVST